MIHPIHPDDVCYCGDLRHQHEFDVGPCMLGKLCQPEQCQEFRFFAPFDYKTNPLYQPAKVAISLWQPWAWAMFNDETDKDIENRPTRTSFRGRLAIAISQKTPREEYLAAKQKIESMSERGIIKPGIKVPYASEVEHGSIIGIVTVYDCVDRHPSPWFFGPWGYCVKEQTPCRPIPCKGQQGFWNIPAELQNQFQFFWRKDLDAQNKKGQKLFSFE